MFLVVLLGSSAILLIVGYFCRIYWYQLNQKSTVTKSHNKWTYYPAGERRAKYGIVTAGTPDRFFNFDEQPPPATYSTCMAQLYARQHGYAFFVHKDLGAVNNRSYGNCKSQQMSPWNKVALVKQYLIDVDILLWVDLDGFFQNFSRPLEEALPMDVSRNPWLCRPSNATHLGRAIRDYASNDLPGSSPPFLWLSSDVSAEYSVNVNSAVFALRQCEMAFTFLDAVWKVGDDKHAFKRHDFLYTMKWPCKQYWGWPWEQGGMWDVLSGKNRSYLRSTCVLPNVGVTGLNTVIDRSNDPGKNDPVVLDRNGPLIVHHPKHAAVDWMWRHIREGSFTIADVESICDIPMYTSHSPRRP